jgi:lipid II:glycine glycyltransferase (peptidoglycan interpeptide bridge formation enzyme)
MKQKARYNIKVAEKHGVRARISNQPEKDFEEFWRLMQLTAKRDKIKSHPKDYYFKQLSFFGGDKNGVTEMKLFLAEWRNKIIAANIVVFFGGRATYLHGASDYEKRHLMAPYLLQWEQIKEAKKHGCAKYDFWGIDEKKWPGVTRFKKGFGGEEVEYLGAWDYVFQPTWYKVYRLARKLF